MKNKFDHLIHLLKGKTYPKDLNIEFIKLGCEGFDSLSKLFSSEEATENQLAHALPIMFDVTCKGAQSKGADLFALSSSLLVAESLKVRSSAAKVTAAILSLMNSTPGFLSIDLDKDDVCCQLEAALNAGLRWSEEQYVRKFLDGLKGTQ